MTGMRYEKLGEGIGFLSAISMKRVGLVVLIQSGPGKKDTVMM